MYGEHVTQEEYDVRRALKDYTDDWPLNDDRRARTFVPVARLYETYIRYVTARSSWGEDPPLTRCQFGVVLRRVFPEITSLPRSGRAFRSYDRRRLWGVVGLWGPGCVLTRGYAGRPLPLDDAVDLEPVPETGLYPSGYPFVRPRKPG